MSQKTPPCSGKVTTLVPFIFESNPWGLTKGSTGTVPVSLDHFLIREQADHCANKPSLWKITIENSKKIAKNDA